MTLQTKPPKGASGAGQAICREARLEADKARPAWWAETYGNDFDFVAATQDALGV